MEPSKSFKSKWNEVDQTCPTCGQVTKINRGLTKQNLNKMFRKPTTQDIIILIMIALVIFGAWTYQNETLQYKEIIEHPQELCQIYYTNLAMGEVVEFNSSNIKLNENNKIS